MFHEGFQLDNRLGDNAEQILLALYLLERIPPHLKEKVSIQVAKYDYWEVRNLATVVASAEMEKAARTVEVNKVVQKQEKENEERSRRKKLECYYCKKKGHLAKDCRLRKRREWKDRVMEVSARERPLIVNLELGGNIRRCFLYGGSSVSLVRPEKLSKMDVVALREERTILTAANGTKMLSDAVAQVELRLDNHTLLWTCWSRRICRQAITTSSLVLTY